jgi:gamma-glutamylcyclotransferase (GGCT)/AIG2-like uncharacterized protein YtfP
MTTKVFAYGTLRKGHGNYRHYFRNAIGVIEGVHTKGAMYYAYPGHGWYPIVNFDQDGIVYGDLFTFDDDDEGMYGAHRMERGAGYTLRLVTVMTPSGLLVPDVIAYHSDHEDHGDRIWSGDWNRRDVESNTG